MCVEVASTHPHLDVVEYTPTGGWRVTRRGDLIIWAPNGRTIARYPAGHWAYARELP